MPDRMPEDMPDRMPEGMPDRMSEDMPENMSDRMPEDLPVAKRIDVMVGITRSQVILIFGDDRLKCVGSPGPSVSRGGQARPLR